ncbi:hypothetical protein [Acidipila rosea]|nr:hypothetical protein [Acidipila rosea]
MKSPRSEKARMAATVRAILTLALLLCVSGSVVRAAAFQQDPLSEKDIEKVRDARDQPNERIKLYTKFIDERIATIKDLTGKTRANNRRTQLRDKFQEFTRLADELADNLDTYNTEHADMRKALKDLVAASAKWAPVLSAPANDSVYDFYRGTAVEAAQSVNDQAKKLQGEQDKYFAEHKDQRGKNGTGPD